MPFQILYGISYDPSIGPPGMGANEAVPSQNGFTMYSADSIDNSGLGTAASLSGAHSRMEASIANCDGIAGQLTVECLTMPSAAAWAALTAAGGDYRFMPVMSYLAGDGSVVWALGFFSYVASGTLLRQTRATFYVSSTDTPIINPFGQIITAAPGRISHLAGQINTATGGVGFDSLASCWFDGAPSINTQSFYKATRQSKSGGLVRIGGIASAIPSYWGGPVVVLPFQGVVDEARVAIAARYADFSTFSATYAIPWEARRTPWPRR